MSKHERLALASRFIRKGQVLFPQRDKSELIEQILNFGTEDHDDLLDAFCYLVNESMLNYREPFNPETDMFFC